MCPKYCFVLEYTGYMDYIQEQALFGVVYNPKPNEKYFSLSIRYKTPALLHKEYMINDFYGMVGVVGGTLGLFVGFSFADVIIFLMTCLQKVHDQIKERIRVNKITPSVMTEVKECSEKLRDVNIKQYT